jgi:hypothetical protein
MGIPFIMMDVHNIVNDNVAQGCGYPNGGQIVEISVEGPAVSFETNVEAPLVSLEAQIVALQEGSGTPSPSNVRPISGFSSVNVKRTGKNLLPPLSEEATSRNVTFTPRTDGGIDLSGTATGGVAVVDLGRSENLWLNAGTYFVNESTSLYIITVFDETSGTATVLKSGGGSFTITSRTKVFVRLGIPNGTATGTTVYIQLELGSSATTFSQYAGDEVTITLGQTVYGGSLNVTTGKLTITHKVITVEAVRNLAIHTNNIYYWIVDLPDTSINGTDVISSHFVGGRSVSKGNCYITGDGQILIIVPTDQTLNTKELADAWCTENKPQFVYPLAEEITVQLSPAEVNTIIGMNNISANTGDVKLTYIRVNK